jgi:hypothetical protein
MSPFEIVLKGVLMPMAAGLAPLAIGMRLWRRDAPPAASGWGLAVAVAVTFALALWVQEGDKLWELRQKWQWLWALSASIAAASVVIAIPLPWPRIPASIKGSLLVAIAGAFAVLMLKPPGFDEFRDRIVVFLAIAGPAWLAMPWCGAGDACASDDDRGPVRFGSPGWSVGIAFWLAASGLSGVVLASGFAKLAIPLGALAALSMAAAVLSLRGKRDLGYLGIATLAATLGAAALVGWAYDDTEIPAWSFLAMAVAPTAMRIPLPRTWWFAASVRLAIVLLVVGAAGGTAAVKGGMLEPADGQDGSEYDYGYGRLDDGSVFEPPCA